MADLAAFADYLRVQRGLAPKTVTGYVRTIRELGDTPLEPEAIERWSTAKGGAASSVGVRLSAVKAWARFQHLPDPTAELERPKRHKGLPRPVADSWRDLFVGEDPRFYMVAVFLDETGLRISEACSVGTDAPPGAENGSVGQPEAAVGILRVTGKGGKTRLVPLTNEAQAALAYLGGRMPWGPRAIQRRFQVLGEKHGCRITAHMFRHHRATTLVRRHVDIGVVSKLLGHSSPAVTMVYAQYDLEPLQHALGIEPGVEGAA